MKITLIGASGFVGTRLIELLKQNNYFLQNVDKQQSRFHSEITVIANVLDKNNLVTLLDNTDVVIYLQLNIGMMLPRLLFTMMLMLAVCVIL